MESIAGSIPAPPLFIGKTVLNELIKQASENKSENKFADFRVVRCRPPTSRFNEIHACRCIHFLCRSGNCENLSGEVSSPDPDPFNDAEFGENYASYLQCLYARARARGIGVGFHRNRLPGLRLRLLSIRILPALSVLRLLFWADVLLVQWAPLLAPPPSSSLLPLLVLS